MRRAIVHIGTPRTGTTTLQRVLFSHRDALAQAGILYPDLTPAGEAAPHLSHQYLGEALAGRRPVRQRAELLARLEALLAASNCDTVLISYEALCRIPAAFGAAGMLAGLFARQGLAMEVLMTLKPQAEYLNSTYTWRMQFLRETRPFAAWLRAAAGRAECDYGGLLAPWRRAAGDRATIVPVRDPRDPAPLVERVFAALALTERTAGMLRGEDRALVENRSPGPVAVEVCRRLPATFGPPRPGGEARAMSRFVEQAARDAGEDRVPFMGLDADLRARVEARWAAANARFAAALWGETACKTWEARVGEARVGEARVGEAAPAAMNEIARRGAPPHIEALVADILRRTGEAFALRRPSRAAILRQGALGASARLLDHLRRHARALPRA